MKGINQNVNCSCSISVYSNYEPKYISFNLFFNINIFYLNYHINKLILKLF